jgi:hypothetical protein
VIYEYAVEPNLPASWGTPSAFRYFVEKFGIGSPRLAAALPSRVEWSRTALTAADGLEGLDHTRSVELVRLLQENMCERPLAVGESDADDWLAHAHREHGEYAFHAILTNGRGVDQCPCCLDANTVGMAEDDRWCRRLTVTVPRTAGALVDTLRPVLTRAKEVLLVDPYFRLKHKRYSSVFQRLLRVIEQDRDARRPPLNRFEVLAAGDEDKHPSTGLFHQECRAELRRAISSTLRVTIRRLGRLPGGERLHDRFLLSDIGSLQLSTGFDEGDVGESVTFTLLTRHQHQHWWRQFGAGDSGAFSVIDEVEIGGAS